VFKLDNTNKQTQNADGIYAGICFEHILAHLLSHADVLTVLKVVLNMLFYVLQAERTSDMKNIRNTAVSTHLSA
jgi:hypothetical protein